jgi:hypothetical protein
MGKLCTYELSNMSTKQILIEMACEISDRYIKQS